MPSFGDALTAVADQCGDRLRPPLLRRAAWPRGDLNFPRAFFTEKAFPENEVVYTNTVTRGDDAAVGNEIVYERRFGARNQIEAVVPIDASSGRRNWTTGIGDVAFAFRRTFFSSTRDVARSRRQARRWRSRQAMRIAGLGNGYHVIEPFAMFGQALPHNSFLQMHGGLEIPSNATKAPKEAYLRTAFGTTYMADRGLRPVLVAAGGGALGAGRSASTPSGTSCRNCKSASRRSSTSWSRVAFGFRSTNAMSGEPPSSPIWCGTGSMVGSRSSGSRGRDHLTSLPRSAAVS